MFNHFSEIPQEHADTLKTYYFDKWKGQIDAPEADQAGDFVRPGFIYLQRMFWQARYDKMSTAEKDMFDLFSCEILEPEAGYKGIKYRENLIGDVDHDLYAARMFDRLWKLYAEDETNGLLPKKKPTVVSRVLDLFRSN